MKWVEALKEYAKTNGKYVVPKKGTPAYDAVKKLMGEGAKATETVEVKDGSTRAVRKRVPKAPKVAEEHKAEGEAIKAVAKAHKKEGEALKKAPAKRARRTKKTVKIEEANTADLHPVLGMGGPKAGSAEVGGALIPEGVTKKAVLRSKNPSAVLESATNSHIAIASPENMVKLKPVANLRKELKEVEHPALPSLVHPTAKVSATPFSFQDLRNHLGC